MLRYMYLLFYCVLYWLVKISWFLSILWNGQIISLLGIVYNFSDLSFWSCPISAHGANHDVQSFYSEDHVSCFQSCHLELMCEGQAVNDLATSRNACMREHSYWDWPTSVTTNIIVHALIICIVYIITLTLRIHALYCYIIYTLYRWYCFCHKWHATQTLTLWVSKWWACLNFPLIIVSFKTCNITFSSLNHNHT